MFLLCVQGAVYLWMADFCVCVCGVREAFALQLLVLSLLLSISREKK